MKPKQKAINYFCGNIDCRKECEEVGKQCSFYKALDIALKEQAKEIFCDIEMMDIDDLNEIWAEDQYKKIKEKYLPISHNKGK